MQASSYSSNCSKSLSEWGSRLLAEAMLLREGGEDLDLECVTSGEILATVQSVLLV
jgi:hypothetical protein